MKMQGYEFEFLVTHPDCAQDLPDGVKVIWCRLHPKDEWRLTNDNPCEGCTFRGDSCITTIDESSPFTEGQYEATKEKPGKLRFTAYGLPPGPSWVKERFVHQHKLSGRRMGRQWQCLSSIARSPWWWRLCGGRGRSNTASR